MTQIQELLDSGADPNTADHKGFTLLMSFCVKNDTKSIKALIEHGALMELKDQSGLNALDYAINNDSLESIEMLVAYGCSISSDNYMLAINKNKKDIVLFFDSLDENKQIWLEKKKK